jgi:hypothetical protein
MSLPRTARAAVGDYCYYVINHGNNRAVAFSIGRLDEPMAALLDLDASLRPIGRPQALEEMQNVPVFTLGVLKLLNSVLLTHIIHECFYCNRRYAATTRQAASSTRPASRLALRDLHILYQVCVGLSGLRVFVSPGVLAVS